MKRPLERGAHGTQHGGRGCHAIFFGVSKVNLGDGALHMKERAGRIKEHDLNSAHVRHLLSVRSLELSDIELVRPGAQCRRGNIRARANGIAHKYL